MLSSGSITVRRANKESSSYLLPRLPDLGTSKYSLKLVSSEELENDDQDVIWSIFEDNMRTLYSESSFGWNPSSKREELFDSLSRFFLVYTKDQLVAFVMFRFEHEDNHDVVYCYDLQVSSAHRRASLGRGLIRALEVVGRRWSMDKIMLTVLKANHDAMQFYIATGFMLDECSPGYEIDSVGEVEADYEILSKKLS